MHFKGYLILRNEMKNLGYLKVPITVFSEIAVSVKSGCFQQKKYTETEGAKYLFKIKSYQETHTKASSYFTIVLITKITIIYNWDWKTSNGLCHGKLALF